MAARRSTVHRRRRRPTILVIDDDPDARDSIALVLSDAGYDVETVSGGEEALEHLKRAHQPGLILLDLMMPNMTGWEFRAEQRRDPRLSAIPVVLVSAADEVADAADELAVAGYLAKPFDLDQLLEQVAAHQKRS